MPNRPVHRLYSSDQNEPALAAGSKAGASDHCGLATSTAFSLPAAPSAANTPPTPSSPTVSHSRKPKHAAMPTTMRTICLTSVHTTPPTPPSTV